MIFAHKLTTALLTAFLLVGCNSLPQVNISFEDKESEEDTTQLESTTPESSPQSVSEEPEEPETVASQPSSIPTQEDTQSTDDSAPEIAATKPQPTAPESSPAVNKIAKSSGSNLIGLEDTPSPNKEMIMDLDKLGIFDNLGQDFNLLEPISRIDYMSLLYHTNNTLRSQEENIRLSPAYDPGFTDLDSSHPAYKYIQALANAGYSVGYDDNSFKPDQPITREEMIGIKVSLDVGTEDGGHNIWNFSDFEQIDSKFVPYIYKDNWLDDSDKGTNIQRAFGNIKSFKPKEPVLGYEAAATLWQIGGASNKEKTAIDRSE